MKKWCTLLVILLVISAMLAGCGGGTITQTRTDIKNEASMKEDLSAKSGLFVDGTQITNLTVIKRLTNEEDRTDEVYVSVELDHPGATAVQNYKLNYTKYNEGWMLDSVEEYYNEEYIWDLEPKGGPTPERIESELLQYSANEIQLAEEGLYLYNYATNEYTKTFYYYEYVEGQYALKVYDGKLDGNHYRCLVTAEKDLYGAPTYVCKEVSFLFNAYTYEWDLREVLPLEYHVYENGVPDNWMAVIGVEEITYGEEYSDYIELSEKVIQSYYIDHDFNSVVELMSPYMNVLLGGESDEELIARLQRNSNKYDSISTITPIAMRNEEDLISEKEDIDGFKARYKEAGYDIDEVAAGEFWFVVWKDGEFILEKMDFIFVRTDGELYFLLS